MFNLFSVTNKLSYNLQLWTFFTPKIFNFKGKFISNRYEIIASLLHSLVILTFQIRNLRNRISKTEIKVVKMRLFIKNE